MKKIILSVLAVVILALTACSLNLGDFMQTDPGTTSGPTPTPLPSFARAEFDRIDGSTVVIPLAEGWAEQLFNIGNGADVIQFNTTPDAIANLTNGTKDIIFTTYPSEAEIANARAKGVEFTIIPVVNDAFVFLVNDANKVNGLTSEQIRQIYSGKITNWSKVGGEDISIMAFQRAEGSGSQSGMLRFMGNTKLAQAPTEAYLPLMGELIDAIIQPDVGQASLGYSYYYYVNAMYIKEDIKLLALDGVPPSNETIRNGTYPVITPYYAIINKNAPADSFARRFLNFTLSPQGQDIAEQVGYVKLY